MKTLILLMLSFSALAFDQAEWMNATQLQNDAREMEAHRNSTAFQMPTPEEQTQRIHMMEVEKDMERVAHDAQVRMQNNGKYDWLGVPNK